MNRTLKYKWWNACTGKEYIPKDKRDILEIKALNVVIKQRLIDGRTSGHMFAVVGRTEFNGEWSLE
jgi:hypothetical protein